MLRCSDVMPGGAYADAVEQFGLESSRPTYGSVARALLKQRVAASA
jgi:Arc/MetJ family transcription regulator